MDTHANSSIMLKYLVTNAQDLLWGITVTTVGTHQVKKNYDFYPPTDCHPTKYYLLPQEGRVIDEFQLVYITKGEGKFYTRPNNCIDIKEGDMLLLMPGLWHCYYPNKETGWNEYWIGFKGEIMDLRSHNGFFNNENCIYKVGMRDEIANLYQHAINVATQESTAYQQVLAGIANLLLGLSIAYDKKQQFENYPVVQITKAKMMIRENIYSKITAEEIANTLNMSYSWFRKTFKEFTGLSPASYIQKLKLQAAKDSLISTNQSIKEIANNLYYDNAEHFSIQFKKHIGMSPKDYRTQNSRLAASKLSD